MANLALYTPKITAQTGTAGWKCHGKMTPGSNQKVVLRIRAKFKNTSTTPLWVEARVRVTVAGNVTGGTFSAASTWNKKNPIDAETPRTSWQECTANPTVGGSTVNTPVNYSANSQEEWVTGTLQLNAADVLLFEVNGVGTDVAFDYEVDIVE